MSELKSEATGGLTPEAKNALDAYLNEDRKRQHDAKRSSIWVIIGLNVVGLVAIWAQAKLAIDAMISNEIRHKMAVNQELIDQTKRQSDAVAKHQAEAFMEIGKQRKAAENNAAQLEATTRVLRDLQTLLGLISTDQSALKVLKETLGAISSGEKVKEFNEVVGAVKGLTSKVDQADKGLRDLQDKVSKFPNRLKYKVISKPVKYGGFVEVNPELPAGALVVGVNYNEGNNRQVWGPVDNFEVTLNGKQGSDARIVVTSGGNNQQIKGDLNVVFKVLFFEGDAVEQRP